MGFFNIIYESEFFARSQNKETIAYIEVKFNEDNATQFNSLVQFNSDQLWTLESIQFEIESMKIFLKT